VFREAQVKDKAEKWAATGGEGAVNDGGAATPRVQASIRLM